MQYPEASDSRAIPILRWSDYWTSEWSCDFMSRDLPAQGNSSAENWGNKYSNLSLFLLSDPM